MVRRGERCSQICALIVSSSKLSNSYSVPWGLAQSPVRGLRYIACSTCRLRIFSVSVEINSALENILPINLSPLQLWAPSTSGFWLPWPSPRSCRNRHYDASPRVVTVSCCSRTSGARCTETPSQLDGGLVSADALLFRDLLAYVLLRKHLLWVQCMLAGWLFRGFKTRPSPTACPFWLLASPAFLRFAAAVSNNWLQL